MSLYMTTFNGFLVNQATWPMNQSCIKKAPNSRDEWVLGLQITDILVKQQLWIVSLGLLLLAAWVSLTYSGKLVKWRRSDRPKNYNMFLIGRNSTKTWHRTWEIQLNLKNCVYDEFLLKTHHTAILKEGKREKRLKSAKLYKHWTENQQQQVLRSDESKSKILGLNCQHVQKRSTTVGVFRHL